MSDRRWDISATHVDAAMQIVDRLVQDRLRAFTTRLVTDPELDPDDADFIEDSYRERVAVWRAQVIAELQAGVDEASR